MVMIFAGEHVSGALAAGFLPVMVLSPAASTVTPAQVTRQGLL
jgi:hypothetical protein